MKPHRISDGQDAAHTRGSAYLVVLGTAMIVTVLGLSSVMLMRVRQRVSDTTTNVIVVGIGAPNTLDLAVFRITNDPNWRTTYVNDQWTAEEDTLDYACSFKLVDEIDGDLASDPTQPVRLYGRASAGDAVRIYSVLLEATKPINLLTNGDLEDGATGWTGVGPLGTCNLISDTSAPKGGSACLLTANRNNSYAGPHQNITDKIVNGKTYYTELWIKGQDSSNGKWIVIDLDTSGGMQSAAFYATWAGTNWHKVTTTLTPTWTGTLNAAYWKVGTGNLLTDFRIDSASLIEGSGPATFKMVQVQGTWRQETAP